MRSDRYPLATPRRPQPHGTDIESLGAIARSRDASEVDHILHVVVDIDRPVPLLPYKLYGHTPRFSRRKMPSP